MTDPFRVRIGEGIYLAVCAACHQDRGRETDDRGLSAPKLAGQRATYLANQLDLYADGRRPYGIYMMGRAHSGLDEAGRGAVAQFFAAQPREPPPAPEPKRRRQRSTGR